jgi:hypothetical protein
MFLSGTYGPNYKPKGPTANQVVVIAGKVYKKKDIPGLFDSNFILSYNLWARFKRFGLPFNLGWAEHPAILIDHLEAWEAANDGRNT